MKRLEKVLVMVVVLVGALAFQVNAQESAATPEKSVVANTPAEDFFIGKWKLDVYGLPQGDAKMLMMIEKKDGKLAGWLGGENGEEPNEFTKVEIEKETLYVRFLGGGWDVPMYLDKDGDDAVVGSMNDMFDVEGTKVKE
ncbi:hypothetical protein [Mangrovibacterium marinum]|uniref:Lipocalin-like protein n=1 Tax=Mangrovibacterium marinum TaxID=1639118 RepID=A0A2T5BYY8_9BACT|nr:hypothetical protein [Mangrovibacterium marinum]PTN07462.1 hypothetical protein C8N47_11757 [Mangrovibacterium marinum]